MTTKTEYRKLSLVDAQKEYELNDSIYLFSVINQEKIEYYLLSSDFRTIAKLKDGRYYTEIDHGFTQSCTGTLEQCENFLNDNL